MGRRAVSLPLSKEDLPAFCFWWALGIVTAVMVVLFFVLVTPLEVDGTSMGIAELVGSVTGWKVWWWARNP